MAPSMRKILMVLVALALLMLQAVPIVNSWKPAHATFYTGNDMGAACGYENVNNDVYGTNTAAVSSALFDNGEKCGACFKITCDAEKDSQWCLPGKEIIITATNNCPPNNALPSDNGGWCNYPLEHFDLSQNAFLQIAQYKSGIVPVKYKKVPCQREGGIRFTMKGSPYFELVLISNVGGRGEIAGVWIKGPYSGWQQMIRNWGANWQTFSSMTGQSLSFVVMSSNGRLLVFNNVVPSSWQFGQTYYGSENF